MLEDCKNDINNTEKNNLEKKGNKTESDDESDINIPEIKGKIANSFLIDVIIDDNQKDDNTIFIKFDHIIGHWKRNWDLDAIILTPVN